jgi:stage III sporulation protein SpoIIIAA
MIWIACWRCCPRAWRGPCALQPDRDQLLEVVLDLGRVPEARYPGRALNLGQEPVQRG